MTYEEYCEMYEKGYDDVRRKKHCNGHGRRKNTKKVLAKQRAI